MSLEYLCPHGCDDYTCEGECKEEITDDEANDMGADLVKDILVSLGHSREAITDKLVERTISNALWASVAKCGWRGKSPQF